MASPVTFVYKKVGACEIKADVYQPSAPPGPRAAAGRTRAAIVHIHGGCLIYGTRRGIDPRQLELYLGAGYVVISIDYRLAPETKLPQIVGDLCDAFRWVGAAGPDLPDVDPERIAVVGHSAGGYLALMSGYAVKPRPRAIVSFYGYGDIVGDWYSKPDPYYCTRPAVSEEASGRGTRGPAISEPYEGRGKDQFYLYCRQHGTWPQEVGGRDPAVDPGFFLPYCPLRNVRDDYPPTLLLHADGDTDVPYEQSVLMAAELARRDVQHGLLTMRGRGHGFDRAMADDEVKAAFRTVLGFLEAHLGPGRE